MNNKCQEEYIRRIHMVQDYMEQHIGEALSIEELSSIAGFSKYHFSRIFQGILHEPLAHYVYRIRMERALFLLVHRQDKNLTDIGYELGYNDSAVFSRAFRNFYNVSPREFRKEYSKNRKESFRLSEYNGHIAKNESDSGICPVSGEIELVRLEEKKAIYVRHDGNYQTLETEYERLFHALLSYASAHQLVLDEKTWILAIYHDNPEFGEANQFRTSLCMTVPEGVELEDDGIVGIMTLPGGEYAVGRFELQREQYGAAWDHMYRIWLSGSGYVPRDANPYEVYCNDPKTDEKHLHKVDIYVPVEPIHF